MFSLDNKQLHIKGLYDIVANYSSLFNDGDNDLLYLGTNNYSSKILGSILYEDDDENYLRYIHSIVTDEILYSFLSRKITLRDVITNSKLVYIVDKDYNHQTIDSALIPLEDLPNDFLPLENSYCPKLIKNNTLNYKFSLQGGLADMHKGEPLSISDTNAKVYNLLSSATTFLNEIKINPKIYSKVAQAGSFELNFTIELDEGPANLFSKPFDELPGFFIAFFNYLFEKLPNEPNDIIRRDNAFTADLKSLVTELKHLYNTRNFSISEEASEQKIIDMITYSVDAIKNINYNGFNRIEVGNKLKNGETLPVALIKTNYYDSVISKIFRPEEEAKPNIVEIDEAPKMYKIQVYSLNKETGNGGAYFVQEEKIIKVNLHLRGLRDYHGTIFTKSLDEDLIIETIGLGKWVNKTLKEITIDIGI